MTRRIIVDAARNLFEQQGYDETSMEDIARDAGCSRRTPYNHFENKRNLWYAVVYDDNLEFYQVMKRTAEEPHADELARYRAIARAGFLFMAKNPQADRRVSEFQVHSYRYRLLPDLQHDFARRCAEVNDQIADLVSTSIRAAQREGSVRSDRDPFELLIFSAAVMTGASNLAQFRLAQDENGDFDELFEQGWRYVLRILQTSTTRAGKSRSKRPSQKGKSDKGKSRKRESGKRQSGKGGSSTGRSRKRGS